MGCAGPAHPARATHLQGVTMKIIHALLIASAVFAASVATADDDIAGHTVVFSKYSPALRLTSYEERTMSFNFSGTVQLSGMLFLEFDQDENGSNGEINFAKFAPDPASAKQLPAVISGFYPAPVKSIDVDTAPMEQFEVLFGGKEKFARLSHGTQPIVSMPAVVTLHKYEVTIECDARNYVALDVSIRPVVSRAASSAILASTSTSLPDGC
jgi:hypothetical protein